VKPDNMRTAGIVLDGDDIKAQRTLLDVTFAEEIMRGANEHLVLLFGDAQFRQGGLIFRGAAGADLDDGEGIAIVPNEVEFTFGARRHVIARNENIAEAPQVPVSIRFPTHAHLQRLVLIWLRRGVSWITESFP
jgi:hypothetical protein